MNSKTKYATTLFGAVAGVLMVAACIWGFPGGAATPAANAQAGTQTTFLTPSEASQALDSAAQANDETALVQILGSRTKTILSSGDPAVDKQAQDSFAAKYREMNRWVTITDGSQVLYVGADNYAFPIPLSRDSSSRWYFNAAAGEEEVLAREIGKNELLAIDACSAIANAEELYFRAAHDGNLAHQYTQSIISNSGKQDGLYWQVAGEDGASPLGRLETFLSGPIVPVPSGQPQVFDGYNFRILTAQGAGAKGGAKNYLVNGKLTGGFAIIASPVQYGHTGIMTFLLSREGVICQKDLGKDTAAMAAAIQAYNPADDWAPVQ
jgi:Protein of unknown function (DUF2950)